MTEKLAANAMQLKQAITICKEGGVVAFPTDTVYGLGASINNPDAISKIYEIKQRPRSMPLPLLITGIPQLEALTTEIPPIAYQLAKRFLPGALTLILNASPAVPDIITGGGSTIAIRIPANSISLALIEGVGAPIIGTSANISGKPSPLTADEVRSQLGSKVDFIIEGGGCAGIESTTVDLSGKTPVIHREGAIPEALIMTVIRSLE